MRRPKGIYIFIFLARTNPRGSYLFNKYISGRPLSRIFKFQLGARGSASKFRRCSNIEKSLFPPPAHFSTDYTGPEPGYNTKVWNKTTALTKPISIYQPRQGLIRSANLSTLNRPGTRYDVTMRSVLWSGYLRPVRSLCCNMPVDS